LQHFIRSAELQLCSTTEKKVYPLVYAGVNKGATSGCLYGLVHETKGKCAYVLMQVARA